jgi:hypothetical protein
MSNKQFITQSFDKFDEKASTYSNPQMITVHNIMTAETPWPTWNLGIRHVKTKETDTIVIDAHYGGQDWFFLRSGSITFATSSGPVKINPEVSGESDVHSGGVCEENETYPISKDDFFKICNSNTLEIKIAGSGSFIEAKKAAKFHILCKQFYNNLFDSSKFTESLNQKAGGFCFIATAAMGSYDHPQVMELRNFRDEWILTKNWGSSFVNWYYHYGAKAAKIIDKSSILKKISYLLIVTPLVYLSRILK